MSEILNKIQALPARKKAQWLVGIILLTAFAFCLPDPLFDAPTSYVIESQEGELLGALVAEDGQWRFPAKEKVPDKFVDCLLSFEDKRFRYHPGVDPIAIARALKSNVSNQKIISGASTIHMQVIRLSRGKDRNIAQKLLEAIMAIRLELAYSKDEILSLYAANAPFGGNVVGLEAASWRYYGRSPETLSWAESATMAVLPNAPSLIHPGRNRNQLLDKRNRVLDRLHEKGKIDENTWLLSKTEPLPEVPLPLPQEAPHLLQWHKKREQKNQSSDTDTRLLSSLDAGLQKQVNNIAQRHQEQLSQNGIHNASILVLDVRSAKVLAYVGNTSGSFNSSYVDIIRSRRSPGSLLKPLLYAAMLSDGMLMPHALVPDIPTQMSGYIPMNFDLQYDGAVRASSVVSRSLNIPSVRMLHQYHYARFYKLIRQLGLNTLDKGAAHYGLSMILGGGEVTLWDIATLYGRLAAQYQAFNSNEAIPVNIASFQENAPQQQVSEQMLPLDAPSLWYMFSCMDDVIRPGDEGYWQQFQSSRRVAWKTGTSFGFRDAWSIGVTPEYVVAVWVGNANGEGRPGLIGVRTAAPIMFEVFGKLPATTWFASPARSMSATDICLESGFKAGPYCTDLKTFSVPVVCIKSKQCPYHQQVHLNASGFRVNSQCASPSEMQVQGWFVLPPAMEEYYRRKHFGYKPLPPFRQGCNTQQATSEMDILYPPDGAHIKVPKDLDGLYQEAIFQVAHRRQNATVYWSLDDDFSGTTQAPHQLPFRPEPGLHILTVTDDKGESRKVKFIVME